MLPSPCFIIIFTRTGAGIKKRTKNCTLRNPIRKRSLGGQKMFNINTKCCVVLAPLTPTQWSKQEIRMVWSTVLDDMVAVCNETGSQDEEIFGLKSYHLSLNSDLSFRTITLVQILAQKIVAIRKKQQLSIGPCKSLPNSPSHSSVCAAPVSAVHVSQQTSNGGGSLSDYSSSVPSTPSTSQKELRIDAPQTTNTPTPIRKQSKRRSNLFTVSHTEETEPRGGPGVPLSHSSSCVQTWAFGSCPEYDFQKRF
ncbi:hypothetical protein GOODEAATRI_000309 [Goodea atripinnis]|uniref:Uncharacterized protein n=1 Tax=Goodea atripinnis TaxID=208336 RepID=A0ABV0N6N7_9TELE